MINSIAVLKSQNFRISYNRLISAMEKYKDIFCRSCIWLTENNYMLSVADFDEKMVLKAIRQEYPEYFKASFCVTSTGRMDYSARRCRFALKRATKLGYDKEFIKLLSVFTDAITANFALNSMNLFLQRFKIRNKSFISIPCKIDYSDEGILDRTVGSTSVPEVREAFEIDDSEHIETIHISNILRDYMLIYKFGISQDEINSHLATNEAFFIDGFTVDEELEYFDYVFNGEILCNGKYGSYMVNFIKSYIESARAATDKERAKNYASKGSRDAIRKMYSTEFVPTKQVPYQSDIESDNTLKAMRTEYIQKEFARLKNEYKSVRLFYIDKNNVYYAVSQSDINTEETSTGCEFKVPLKFNGTYVYNYGTGEGLSEINLLLPYGAFGEFISETQLQELNLICDSAPVTIYTPRYLKTRNDVCPIKLDSELFYRVSDIKIADIKGFLNETLDRPIELDYSTNYSLKAKTEKDLWGMYGCATKSDFYQTIRKNCYCSDFLKRIDRNMLSGYFDYVAELVCALIYFRNGVSFYTTNFTGYDYIDESLFLMACWDAIGVYGSIINQG